MFSFLVEIFCYRVFLSLTFDSRLETKRLQKRAEREEKEKLEAKERERLRRKTGQEMTQLKHEMELREAKKIAEQKKREKMEEKMARSNNDGKDKGMFYPLNLNENFILGKRLENRSHEIGLTVPLGKRLKKITQK